MKALRWSQGRTCNHISNFPPSLFFTPSLPTQFSLELCYLATTIPDDGSLFTSHSRSHYPRIGTVETENIYSYLCKEYRSSLWIIYLVKLNCKGITNRMEIKYCSRSYACFIYLLISLKNCKNKCRGWNPGFIEVHGKAWFDFSGLRISPKI